MAVLRGGAARGLLLLLALLVLPAPAGAAAPAAEYDVKAAFLYNFTKFVEWPAAAFTDPAGLKICVLGQDPFGGSLRAFAGEAVGSRKLAVQHVDSPAAAGGCQVLFISRSERGRIAQVVAALGDAPVLTVGDADGLAAHGVAINFVPEGSKIRFEINPGAAGRAGVKISSKLLQLAARIVPGPGARPVS